MEVNFDIYSVLLLLGSFQGVLFFLLLLVRGLRSHSLSDGLMGTLLLLLVVQIFPFMISFMGSSLIWSDLLFFPFDIGLLLGPVIYFYLKSQTNAEFRLQKRDLLHALPYVIYVAYHLSIFVQGKQYVQYWLANVHLSYNVPMIFGCAVLLSNYFYLFLAMRYYGEFRQWLEAEFS
ncbi:MAG: AraC family transcriptional regulator, partial [Bacteroidota bacterium]